MTSSKFSTKYILHYGGKGEWQMTKRELLCEMGYEDSIVFENPDYDSAIVGVSDNGEIIYDFDKWCSTL